MIDLETAERHPQLSDGQRLLDIEIATDNVAGGLLDLQAGGRLQADIDPWEVSGAIEDRYRRCGPRSPTPRSSTPMSCGSSSAGSNGCTSSASTSARWSW